MFDNVEEMKQWLRNAESANEARRPEREKNTKYYENKQTPGTVPDEYSYAD